MPNLLVLTVQIVSAHLSNIQMTSDEILLELQKVHESLKDLESGPPNETNSFAPAEATKLTLKKAFKKEEVICMVCGKRGFKTLKRHLGQVHQQTPKQYRKQFSIPSTQKLAAKSYSESRRQMAIDKRLGEGLAFARAAKKEDASTVHTGVSLPAKRINALLPTVKEKASIPAKRIKAPVPVTIKKADIPAKTL